MDSPKYRCFSKGIVEEATGTVQRSQKWVSAHRGWLEFHADRVVFGDWNLPHIASTQITLYKGWQFPFPVKVLEIVQGNTVYQFGINGWCRPEAHLPDGVQIEKLQLTYSPYSIAVRAFAAVLIGYWLWQRIT